MSFFQPTRSNAISADAMPAPMIELKGRMAKLDFAPGIATAVLTLGVLRIGGEAIVQDLHAGATGVLVVFASLVAYFILNSILKRDENKPYSTTAAYSFSRNPAYLAFFLPLASLAYFDAMTAASATVIYVLGMNLLVIQRQEQDLQNTFGAEFTAYRAATPRWFA